MFKSIGLIGAGVMGEVLINRLVSKCGIRSNCLMAADPGQKRVMYLKNKYGIAVSLSNKDAVIKKQVVILAVKPQQAGEVLAEIRPWVNKQLFISIMAGVTLKKLMVQLNTKRVVRCMPNTPAQMGEGMVVWYAGPGVSLAQRHSIEKIFRALGKDMEVVNDKMVDAATAVSGSGPAYVFEFANQMINAAMTLGFNRNQAEQLVKQTLRGASGLLIESVQPPRVLRARVTSKGGTTEAAFNIIDKSDMGIVWQRAIGKAYARARELSKSADINKKNSN